MSGWISIHRKIKDSWIYSEKPYSKFQAWIDLLLSASHKDNKFLLGSELIEVKKGEFITSETKLAERWGWSRSKVRRFLELLQDDKMIERKSDSKKTTLNIVNYRIYQVSENEKEQQMNSQRTANEQPADTINNVNNYNNINDDDIGPKFIQVFEEEFHRIISPSIFEALNEFIEADGMDEELIIEAIKRTVKQGKRAPSYAISILRNWCNDGVKDMAGVKRADAERKERSQPDAKDRGDTSNTKKSKKFAGHYTVVGGGD